MAVEATALLVLRPAARDATEVTSSEMESVFRVQDTATLVLAKLTVRTASMTTRDSELTRIMTSSTVDIQTKEDQPGGLGWLQPASSLFYFSQSAATLYQPEKTLTLSMLL